MKRTASARIRVNGSSKTRLLLRRVGALLAGLVAGVVLSLGTDIVLHASGFFPPWGQPMNDGLFLMAAVYRAIFNIVGSYIAARVAPDRPMQHALALGALGVAVSIAGTVATWNSGPEFGPKWYPLSLIVMAMPCAWVGGRLRQRQLSAI